MAYRWIYSRERKIDGQPYQIFKCFNKMYEGTKTHPPFSKFGVPKMYHFDALQFCEEPTSKLSGEGAGTHKGLACMRDV